MYLYSASGMLPFIYIVSGIWRNVAGLTHPQSGLKLTHGVSMCHLDVQDISKFAFTHIVPAYSYLLLSQFAIMEILHYLLYCKIIIPKISNILPLFHLAVLLSIKKNECSKVFSEIF